MWSSKAVDTAHTSVPESVAAPVQPPKDLSKPKAEVVHNEADSSSSTTDRRRSHRRHITVESKKRKRWDSTSDDNDADEFSLSSKRSKKHTHDRRDHKESTYWRDTVDSSKKGERDRIEQNQDDGPNLPSRIVSSFKGGSLQITIRQGQKSG